MTAREKEVFLLIKENPMITQDEVAKKLGISRSAVSVHISSLLRQGALRGRGYVVNEAEYHVVAGTAGMDFFGITEGKLSDSVTEKIINYYGQINVRFGGAAYNISEVLCRVGDNVRMIAPIGNDMFGRQITEHCAQLRINVDDCLYLPDMPQSLMLQIRNESTEQRTSMVNYFAEARLTPEFFAGKAKMLQNAGDIILTDILPPESAELLLSTYADREPWLVFSGVVSRLEKLAKLAPLVPHAYLNLRAAAHLTGAPLSEGALSIGKRIRDMGFWEAFVSCDNRAILHVTRGDCVCYPTLPHTRSDSERGKDAFSAGLIASAHFDMAPEARVRFASAVSRLALDRDTGTRALSRETVEQAMRQA